MYEDVQVQTVAADFSKRREQKPSILRTFYKLNVSNYKKAR